MIVKMTRKQFLLCELILRNYIIMALHISRIHFFPQFPRETLWIINEIYNSLFKIITMLKTKWNFSKCSIQLFLNNNKNNKPFAIIFLQTYFQLREWVYRLESVSWPSSAQLAYAISNKNGLRYCIFQKWTIPLGLYLNTTQT